MNIEEKSEEDDDSKGYYLPWNFNNTRYGDFDCYDIEEDKEFFDTLQLKIQSSPVSYINLKLVPISLSLYFFIGTSVSISLNPLAIKTSGE